MNKGAKKIPKPRGPRGFGPNTPQARRPPVEGPKRVRCMVRDRATGREVTKAFGHRTAKWAAAARARENALHRLRRKLGHRYRMTDGDDKALYELVVVAA